MTVHGLGKFIKERRIQLGYSQVKLAKLLNLGTPQFLMNIEADRSPLPIGKLRRLTKALFLDREVVRRIMLDNYDSKVCEALNLSRVKNEKVRRVRQK